MYGDELSERKKSILKAIVESHIERGEPVGSKSLLLMPGINCSSATVRNEMAELEEIKKAVEQMYGVSVKDVNTVNYHGKRKSRYTKDGLQTGRTNHYKKAFVTLAGDDKIDFYSSI